MNTEMTKTETNTLATYTNQASKMLASDLKVPRLLLMQGTSNFVKERKAQMGDLVRSTDAVKFGDPEGTVTCIALTEPTPTWIEEVKMPGQSRFKFKGIVPRTAKNDDLPWTFMTEINDTQVEARRIKALTAYVLVLDSIDEFIKEKAKVQNDPEYTVDLSKALTPLLVTFRSTSLNAGKDINSIFAKARQFGSNPSYYTFDLGCTLVSKNSDTYYVFSVDLTKSKPAKLDYREYIDYWKNIVQTETIAIDDSEEESMEAMTTSDLM